MGRTPTPLTIVVWKDWCDHPKIQALAAQGHRIIPDDTSPDLILHPHAHRWEDAFWPHLDVALRQARRDKRGS